MGYTMQFRDSKPRYALLDILRGVAALSIVIYHWPHFFQSQQDNIISYLDKVVLPFRSALYFIYASGDIAVDLFFSLSGFIFYSLYSLPICKNSISAGRFALLRFSRLYPLHLATLLMVVLLQWAYFEIHGTYFIYQHNDYARFILHCLFVSNWLPFEPFSFNAPVWSVSIEVLLYAIFFLVCRPKLNNVWFVSAVALAGAVVSLKYSFIGRGLWGFFMGGVCYYVVTWIGVRADRVLKGSLLLLVVLIGSIIMFTTSANTDIATFSYPLIAHLVSASSNRILKMEAWDNFMTIWYIKGICFPSLIIVLAINETRLHNISRRLAWIGSISYSSYLLHFPLQLLTVLTISYFSLKIDFTSNVVFVSFISGLIGLSWICFNYFERPMQSFLRRSI